MCGTHCLGIFDAIRCSGVRLEFVPKISSAGRRIRVSICAFVLVKQVNCSCSSDVPGTFGVERDIISVDRHWHFRPFYCDAIQTTTQRLHTSAYVSIRQHTSAYVSIRQHTSAYVSIRQRLHARREHVVNM
jgi:hypothetical protein